MCVCENPVRCNCEIIIIIMKNYDFFPSHAMPCKWATRLSHTARDRQWDREWTRDWLAWCGIAYFCSHVTLPHHVPMWCEKNKKFATIAEKHSIADPNDAMAAAAAEPTKFICIDEVQFFAVFECVCLCLLCAVHSFGMCISSSLVNPFCHVLHCIERSRWRLCLGSMNVMKFYLISTRN